MTLRPRLMLADLGHVARGQLQEVLLEGAGKEDLLVPLGVERRPAPTSKKGVRLAQKIPVGPCTPVAPDADPKRTLSLSVMFMTYAPCAAYCPGRKPPVLAVKRHARPYKDCKDTIQNRFTMENAKGA